MEASSSEETSYKDIDAMMTTTEKTKYTMSFDKDGNAATPFILIRDLGEFAYFKVTYQAAEKEMVENIQQVKLTCRPPSPGQEITSRSMLTAAANGGIACPILAKQTDCNAFECPIDCKVSAWSVFEICSEKCGGGIQTKTRSVVTRPRFGGTGCPKSSAVQECNGHPCSVDCTHTWNAWTACTKTCASGVQQRSIKVIQGASHGGDECPRSEEQICSRGACPIDCKVSGWTDYDTCSEKCGGTGFRTKTRSVINQAAFGGSKCPGTSMKDSDCNTHACPTKPIQNIIGDSTITLTVATAYKCVQCECTQTNDGTSAKYIDAGVKCEEPETGGKVRITALGVGTVDRSVVGKYTVTYKCVGMTSGIEAIDQHRTVLVVDESKPECQYKGGSAAPAASGDMKLEAGFKFTPPTGCFVSTKVGKLATKVEVTNGVDEHVVGEYTLKYRAVDTYAEIPPEYAKYAQYNQKQRFERHARSDICERKVSVVDTLRPVIQLAYDDDVSGHNIFHSSGVGHRNPVLKTADKFRGLLQYDNIHALGVAPFLITPRVSIIFSPLIAATSLVIISAIAPCAVWNRRQIPDTPVVSSIMRQDS
jgi:hypothetical protein